MQNALKVHLVHKYLKKCIILALVKVINLLQKHCKFEKFKISTLFNLLV